MADKIDRAFEEADRRALQRFPAGVAAAPYVAAAVSYVAIGVFFTPFMTFWVIAFVWLLLWTWGVPALVRRLRP